MTLGMQRIQEHQENGIKLKKNWNGNQKMKPWFLILNFLDFIKQNYIDFIRKLDWFPYKPEHLWNLFTRPFLNLPTTTYCLVKLGLGMGWGKKLQDQLKTYFHSFWLHNGTIGWALHVIFSCLNMLLALYNNLVPWTCTLQLPVHAEHSNCLFCK